MEKTKKIRWYHKMFSIALVFCSMFMFVGVGGAYAQGMNQLDIRLGLVTPNLSSAKQWYQKVLGSGVNVEAITVEVVADIPAAIEKVAMAAISSILYELIQQLGKLVNQLLDQIGQLADVYEGIKGELENFNTALYFKLYQKMEDLLPTEGILSGLGIPQDLFSDVVSAAQRLRAAEGLNRYALSSTTVPQSEINSAFGELQDVLSQVEETQISNTNQGNGLRLWDSVNDYNPGNSARIATEVTQAAQNDGQLFQQAQTNIQNSAPADCKVGFITFSGDDDPFSYNAQQESQEPNNNNNSNLSLNNSFRVNVGGNSFLSQTIDASAQYDLTTLSPDACSTLQSTAEVTAASLGISPPTPGGFSDGIPPVLNILNSFLNQVLTQLGNFITNIIGSLSKSLRNIPRIFDSGGIFNTIASDVRSGLGDIRRELSNL